MAKGKTKTGVPNKHLHARISYLQQAAIYLALQGQHEDPQHQEPSPLAQSKITEEASGQLFQKAAVSGLQPSGSYRDQVAPKLGTTSASGAHTSTGKPSHLAFTTPRSGGLSTHFVSHLRQVAQKSLIRVHPNIKHTICRTCSAVLIEGHSCKKYIENLSRRGSKPHADVLVLECVACGAKKRFPVGASKQLRKASRMQNVKPQEGAEPADNHGASGEDIQGGDDG